MQWYGKEGSQSPPLLAIGFLVHQITRSQVLDDVLCAFGRSLSYSAILDFEKYAIISTIEFTDTLSEEELMECFLQLIVHNFDHNENKTTGACTAYVMGLISSQYSKSNILLTANNETSHYF